MVGMAVGGRRARPVPVERSPRVPEASVGTGEAEVEEAEAQEGFRSASSIPRRAL